jgi:uncharacterized repeat protein (TIGR03803 family)
VNGTFYGTTLFGGLHKEECNLSSRGHSGCGTVFTITPSGEEKVIHEFQGGADGNNPASGLIEVKGLLYGTTSSGGYADRAGTVYTITTSGVENVLYTFAGGLDAASPMTNLVYADGKLYGAASYGGSNYFYGAVYSVTTTGIEKVLYSFKGGADGAAPSSALIDVDGALYGTTAFGGVSGCFYNNDTCGTVYRISTEGKERVVHAFLPSGDGSYPHGGLSEIQGMLYGTTTTGGSYGCHPLYQLRYGCGTVYSVSTSGTEQVLHSFSGGADGAFPVARLLAAHGTLYGTTQKHPGTVFALTP